MMDQIKYFFYWKFRNIDALQDNHDQRLGCNHFKAKCSLKCHKCNEIFPCRMCHDDVKFHKENVEDRHPFDRYKVEEIRCNYCKQL